MGKFGISYFELLLMFEVFSGFRLQTEKTVRPHLAFSKTPGFFWFFGGIGQEIRHGCQFLHSLIRALGHLPGGLSRFIPCQPGAHHARLSHLGWGRYGHGLSSRPRESCDHQFLTPLLDFFGYPDGAVTELFNGTLKLRYSSTPFSRKFPSWPVSTFPGCLPVVGPGPGLSFHYPDHDPVVRASSEALSHHR